MMNVQTRALKIKTEERTRFYDGQVPQGKYGHMTGQNTVETQRKKKIRIRRVIRHEIRSSCSSQDVLSE